MSRTSFQNFLSEYQNRVCEYHFQQIMNRLTRSLYGNRVDPVQCLWRFQNLVWNGLIQDFVGTLLWCVYCTCMLSHTCHTPRSWKNSQSVPKFESESEKIDILFVFHVREKTTLIWEWIFIPQNICDPITSTKG